MDKLFEAINNKCYLPQAEQPVVKAEKEEQKKDEVIISSHWFCFRLSAYIDKRHGALQFTGHVLLCQSQSKQLSEWALCSLTLWKSVRVCCTNHLQCNSSSPFTHLDSMQCQWLVRIGDLVWIMIYVCREFPQIMTLTFLLLLDQTDPHTHSRSTEALWVTLIKGQ